jgi:Ca-activated chloride channel family protein
VEPGEDVERAVSLLATRISHPVLTDVRIVESPVAISDWYPVHIPDVFAGESLVLLARYRGEGEGRVVVEGRRGGEIRRITTSAVFPRVQPANGGLPRLWAARKIGHLTRQLWTEGETPALVEEIRSTALRYGLPSPFTSLLVQEPPTRVVDAVPLRPEAQPAAPVAVRQLAAEARVRTVASGTGAEAVRTAEASRRFRAAGRTDELEALADALEEAGAGGRRILAGRAFRLHDGVWVEEGVDGEAPVVRVKRFGSSWFDLVRALPGLEAAFRAGRVELAGEGLRVRIDDDGQDTLTQAERERVVRALGGGR